MSVPGSDNLSIAMSVLGSTEVNYFAFASRTLNAGGVYVTTYATPQPYDCGMVQPVDRSKYVLFGLDLEKKYVVWYIMELDATDLARDVSGDIMEANNKRYQFIGGTDWYAMDGWMSLIGVEIGPATGALTNA